VVMRGGIDCSLPSRPCIVVPTLSADLLPEVPHGDPYDALIPVPSLRRVERPPRRADSPARTAGHPRHRPLCRHLRSRVLARRRAVRPCQAGLAGQALPPDQWHPLAPHLPPRRRPARPRGVPAELRRLGRGLGRVRRRLPTPYPHRREDRPPSRTPWSRAGAAGCSRTHAKDYAAFLGFCFPERP
jgi:hypothetical protein